MFFLVESWQPIGHTPQWVFIGERIEVFGLGALLLAIHAQCNGIWQLFPTRQRVLLF